jgi:mRNA-capping enzyme
MDKFLAFKTPLDEKFNEQVPIQHRFTPDMVFQSVKNMTPSAKHNERPRIGLWIDLTNTKRFYDSETIANNDCKYMKIECQGHEGAPNIEQTRTFIDLCKIFVSRDPINLIGVHCTHGFNRTGFLIVSYLVEEMECSVEAALAQFARVRQPGIYKAEYLKELYQRYDDVEEAPPPPPLPDWCFDDQQAVVEEANTSRFNGNANRKKKGPRFKDNPTFMDGVPGVCAVEWRFGLKHLLFVLLHFRRSCTRMACQRR